jgi:hypothetical protein
MGERELFQKIKARIVPDLKLSNNTYSKWDCWTSKYQLHIELKCRYAHYDDLLIEKNKYDALMALDTGVRYICSTPVGVYSFNIKEILEPNWIIEKMPQTTNFNDEPYFIEKNVGYINISNSINITHLIY